MPKRLVSLRLGDGAADALAYLARVAGTSQADLVAGWVTRLAKRVREEAIQANPALDSDPELWMNNLNGGDPNGTVVTREEQSALRALLRE